MKEYKLLNDLQKLDIEIDELREKLTHLPEEAALKDFRERLKEQEEALKEKQTQLASKESVQKKVEGELELLDLKIKDEDDKLYSGTITNPKELKSIQQEVVLLRTKKDEIETDLLELLDEVDSLREETNRALSNFKELAKQVEEAGQKYKKVSKEIDQKLNCLKEESETIAKSISDSLISIYKDIREKKKIAAVAIADGVCQGCFVELPAEEVDKMLQTDKLWRCPQCRRIIIR